MPNDKAQLQADELLATLMKGQEVHGLFAEQMQEIMTISGHPIEHWEQEFRIKVPVDNLNPQIMIELDMKLMDLHQDASFYYTAATAKEQFINRGSESAYHGKFYAIVQEFKNEGKKIPAAATLEVLAKIDNQDIESANTIANIEAKYWKGILAHLASCRKLIENATLNISVEMKATANNAALNKLNADANKKRY